MLQARAIARWVRMSPRKMRLVADMVRGTSVRSAVNALHYSTKRASEPVSKTINSALANLMAMEEAAKLDPANVYIKEIYVDEGPTLRRWRPRAMGRASRIRKRTSHLTVVVEVHEIPINKKKRG
ncbi:MAG: 50S ribosomal protein L22 [Candidatus Hatepunaea meridiana]|nr:50S ribosomal protein L22 [Candidatus Hatepunaea meridiana]